MFKRVKKNKAPNNVSPEVQSKAEGLSATLAKFPPYEGVVHRGGQFSEVVIEKYIVGEAVQEPGFTSTSRDPGKVFEGNTHFIICSKLGKDISKFSAHPDEQEVLFDRDAAFMVCRKSLDSTTGEYQIVLTEIDGGWRTVVLSEDEKAQQIEMANRMADDFLATVASIPEDQRTSPAKPDKFNAPVGVSFEGKPYGIKMPGDN